MMARTEDRVSGIYDSLPVTYYRSRTIVCPAETKGKLMRDFREAFRGGRFSLTDGVKVRMQDSWILLLPDLAGPTVNLVVESGNAARGRELFDRWSRRVGRWALER
jgi:mannose-1-phosphate guanylyltransferase/phosphomannomutase